MMDLGRTRTSRHADHVLLTPDSFVRAPLPGMNNATAIVHAAPASGAGFTGYTAELEAGGELGPAVVQRFVYVLDGEIIVEAANNTQRVRKNGYAFLPAGDSHRVSSDAAARAIVIEKAYRKLDGTPPPQFLIGDESAVSPHPLMGDEALEVRELLPASPCFDLAVNIMTFQPGASLPMVESHVMEHGLLMLEGGGIYRLGDHWYPVSAGDFIWMAPFCPQWFGAIGKTPAKYLIYKDWNRHPLSV